MALTDHEKTNINQLVGIEYVQRKNEGGTDNTMEISEIRLSDGIKNLQKMFNDVIPTYGELDTVLKIFKDPENILLIIDHQANNASRTDLLARPTFGEVREHIIQCIDENIKEHYDDENEPSDEQIREWNAEQMIEKVRGMSDNHNTIENEISTAANRSASRIPFDFNTAVENLRRLSDTTSAEVLNEIMEQSRQERPIHLGAITRTTDNGTQNASARQNNPFANLPGILGLPTIGQPYPSERQHIDFITAVI